MVLFPCCCSTCFKPCDCFARNCELHITSEGWTDNAATDCSGIADRVFNKTYAITSMNVTSGPAYGFTCEFLAGEDDLVLTKLSGGGCICQDQPAIYTIEGTLYCERGEDGTYSLRLVLYYKVPVYDETLTCPTPPCPEEPLWETWIWDYTLASGLSSSSAICNLGSSPIGPLGFNTDASAQTSCGLGLDGTDATVTVEWKFCDPPSRCGECCNEEVWDIPRQVQAVVSGFDNTICTECTDFNGTYILELAWGTCYWVSDPIIYCGDYLQFSLVRAKVDGVCCWLLFFTPTHAGAGYKFSPDFCNCLEPEAKCSEASGVVLTPGCELSPNPPFGYWCGTASATITITALP